MLRTGRWHARGLSARGGGWESGNLVIYRYAQKQGRRGTPTGLRPGCADNHDEKKRGPAELHHPGRARALENGTGAASPPGTSTRKGSGGAALPGPRRVVELHHPGRGRALEKGPAEVPQCPRRGRALTTSTRPRPPSPRAGSTWSRGRAPCPRRRASSPARTRRPAPRGAPRKRPRC